MTGNRDKKKAYHQPNVYSLGNVKTLTKGTLSNGTDKGGVKNSRNLSMPLDDPLDLLGGSGESLE